MFTPAELIEALRRRLRRSIRPLPANEGLPPAWQAWVDGIRDRLGPGSRERADALVQALVARGPPPRPAPELLGGWGALRALWRQQWEPPRRDERGLRVFSRSLSIFLHLLFLVALSILMHARFMAPAPGAQRGEHVIEVEFIGSGTPEEEGGGAPPEEVVAESPEPEDDAPQAAATTPQPLETQPAPQPVAEVSEEPPEEPPAPAQPPQEQPLVVTETPLPDGTFQVPPLRAVEITSAQPREVELAPQLRDIELAEIAEVEAPAMRPVESVQPEMAAPELEVAEREILLPPQAVQAPEVARPVVRAPEIPAGERQARVREIPMPPARDAGEASSAAAAEEREPAQGASEPAPPTAGIGPAPVEREGGWTAPPRDDDWGAAERERPGGQAGTASLFNPDGSLRLPGDGEGRVGGGLPPGTITEDYDKIDRMGTWLKRPPTDYEPTSFDRYWVPHENLLQEWVRRSIRTVLIPIPGTSKSIRCDIVTLAVAGGCSIVDPNMQDQPASARPPPDIPFRPELHEDQESLSGDDPHP